MDLVLSLDDLRWNPFIHRRVSKRQFLPHPVGKHQNQYGSHENQWSPDTQ